MNNNFKKSNNESGHVIMIITLFFIAISSAIVYAIINPIISSHNSAQAFVKSKQSFMLASSAGEEVLYRLKNQMSLASSETIILNSNTAEITVADISNEKIITVNSNVNSFEKSLRLRATESTGVSFNYGMQSGRGGFIMSGGARINGNVYSNGDIVGSGNPTITGSAIVATRSQPSAHVSNGSAFPPVYSVDFGGNNTPQDAAQSFTVSTTTPISSIRFYIKKSTNNWMNNTTLKITPDNGGKPHKTTLATANILAQQVTTSYNYISIPFDNPLELTPGNIYWIVFDTNTTWGSYYSIASSQDTYANGLAKQGQWKQNNGGNWSDTSPVGLDIYMNLYAGGDTGSISGVSVGQNGGDAWAHEVSSSNISGNLYCKGGSGNNKACNTSRPDPAELPYPISDGNIEAWKEEAELVGVNVGDVSYGSDDVAIIGPGKIEGDLYVGAGATVSVAGTLYVTGDVTVTGGGVIKLDSSYTDKSGVIVTDGQVVAGGGGKFEGNGNDISYLFVVTTSQCPDSGSCGGNNAIEVSGGTGSVVLNAQQGAIEFSGGASAKQATGETVIMSGGTVVDYESGLTSVEFSSGPAGSFSILEWGEI